MELSGWCLFPPSILLSGIPLMDIRNIVSFTADALTIGYVIIQLLTYFS